MLLYLNDLPVSEKANGQRLNPLPIERRLAAGILALQEQGLGIQLELFELLVRQLYEFPRRGRRGRTRSWVLEHPRRVMRSI